MKLKAAAQNHASDEFVTEVKKHLFLIILGVLLVMMAWPFMPTVMPGDPFAYMVFLVIWTYGMGGAGFVLVIVHTAEAIRDIAKLIYASQHEMAAELTSKQTSSETPSA